MQRVMILSAILTIMLFSGCSTAQPECPAIPQRCVIPATPEPFIDNDKCPEKDSACVVTKALKNYEAQKAYARELKANSEICR